MANSIALSKSRCDITGRSLSIRVNTFGTDNGVKRFERLGCKQYSRAKASNVGGKMKKNVKFRFVEPTTRPPSSTKEEVLDLGLQKLLLNNITSALNSRGRHRLE